MKRLIAMILALCLACTLAVPVLADAPSPNGVVIEEATILSADTTWNDATTLAANLTVNPGVTLTLNAGLTISGEVTISGGGTIQCGDAFSTGNAILITVSAGARVILENILVDGQKKVRLLHITEEGTAIMKESAGEKTILQNGAHQIGAGVIAAGTFILDGGSIQGCAASSSPGGAVYIGSGNFTMNGGEITQCSSANHGGAVATAWNEGTFNMNGGSIHHNQGGYSGAVSIAKGKAVFTGGFIYGNTGANSYPAGVFISGDGQATFSGDINICSHEEAPSYQSVSTKNTIVSGSLTPTQGGIEVFGEQQNAVIAVGTDQYTLTEQDAAAFHNQANGMGLYLDGKANAIKSAPAETLKTITYYANYEEDDSTKTQVVVAGKETALLKDLFIRPQYHLVCWSTSPDGNGEIYANDAQVLFTQDEGGLTLYAQWEEVQVPGTPITPDTGIALNQTSLTLEPGQTAKLKASLTPADATYKYIFWESSDETVATVTDSGLVTAIADGTAIITAKSWYGNTATCAVTVKTPDEPTPVDPWPTEGLEGFVTRCYRVALGRDPDKAGHADWVRWLQDGTVDAKSCASGFIFSKEMNDKNLSDKAFVETLYRVFMDREGEASGVAFWTEYLAKGHTRQEVFDGFADSQEFAGIQSSYGLG